MKDIDPKISAYMSALAKKRKNPYYGFKDKDLAKKAGDAGRLTQKKKRERSGQRQTPNSD